MDEITTYNDGREFVVELPVKLSTFRLSLEEAAGLHAKLGCFLADQAAIDRAIVERAERKLAQLESVKPSQRNVGHIEALKFVLGKGF